MRWGDFLLGTGLTLTVLTMLWMSCGFHGFNTDVSVLSTSPERRMFLRAAAVTTAEAADLNRPSVGPPVKIALAAMLRDSAAFALWLEYYLEYLEFDLLILRVEDCPQCRTLIEPYEQKVIASYVSYEGGGTFDNYHMMMKRQTDHVHNALQICSQKGIAFLLHSDADELLYVQPNPRRPSLARARVLREFLSGVPAEYSSIHMGNYEAMYPRFNEKDSDACFLTNRFVRCGTSQPPYCLSYTNGKAIARVDAKIVYSYLDGSTSLGPVRANGPHRFFGLEYDICKFNPVNPVLAVLHFDACNFDQWEHKFRLLKDVTRKGDNQTTVKDTPFYYQESIRLQQARAQDPGNAAIAKKSRRFYERMKVLPFYHKDYFTFNLWGENSPLAKRVEDWSQPDLKIQLAARNAFNRSDPETWLGARQKVFFEEAFLQ